MQQNPHVVADYGVASGRLGLDRRRQFLTAFRKDPESAVEKLMSRPATRQTSMPNPLVSRPPAPVHSRRVARGHDTRQLRERLTATDVVSKSVNGVLRAFGFDPSAPDVRLRIDAVLGDLATHERKAYVARTKRRARISGKGSGLPPAAALVALWALPDEKADRIGDELWAEVLGGHHVAPQPGDAAVEADVDLHLSRLVTATLRARTLAEHAERELEKYRALIEQAKLAPVDAELVDDDEDY
jgi:hypothetical protein